MDSRFAQNQFASSLGGLPYPLLADFHPKGQVAQAYGTWNHERGLNLRSTFIVDKEGIVRWKESYEPGVVPDVEEVIAELAKLPS